jgi:hypothetical protein
MPAEPAPFLTRLPHLDAAWAEAAPGARLAALRRAARGLHDHLTGLGAAACVRTFDLVTFPYPTRFALNGAALTPVPFAMLRNRMMLVQVTAGGELINILVNPTDAERSLAAPFFARQLERYGTFVARRIMSTVHGTVAGALAAWGLAPDDIDYITFDHLHVQDLRGLLGTADTPALLPRARLLVQKAELDAFVAPHPLQRYWYVADGVAGIAADKIVVLDGDYRIGAGFALIRTPGHTGGNHSPLFMTDRGIWTVSENGVACDAYAPESSHIAGLRSHARDADVEVILNANTREGSLDQYTSMVLEKSLADPCPERPEFPQHFPSSEMVRHPLAPGLAPTFSHGAVTFGAIRARARSAAVASA